jgi:hypothetical protein
LPTYFNGSWYIAAQEGDLWKTPSLQTSWTNVTKVTTHSIQDIAFGNDHFVAIAQTSYQPNESLILLSTNGSSWRSQTPFLYQRYDTIVFDGNKFVISAVSTLDGKVSTISSLDGTTWQRSSVFATNLTFQKMLFVDGKYIALEGSYVRSSIYSSSDAQRWTLLFRSQVPLADLTYGGGKIVGIGGSGFIIFSDDGTNWVQRALPGNIAASQIAFGKGIFVIVTGLGTLLTSADLANWEIRSFGASSRLSTVHFTEKYFLISYFDSLSDQSFFLWSSDGSNWFQQEAGKGSFEHFVSNDQLILGAGRYGFIASAPNYFEHPLLLPASEQHSPPSSFSLYPHASLETSRNLVDWISLTNNPSTETIQITLPPPENPSQFYRFRYSNN